MGKDPTKALVKAIAGGDEGKVRDACAGLSGAFEPAGSPPPGTVPFFIDHYGVFRNEPERHAKAMEATGQGFVARDANEFLRKFYPPAIPIAELEPDPEDPETDMDALGEPEVREFGV